MTRGGVRSQRHASSMFQQTVQHASSNWGVLDLFVAGAGFDIAGAWLLARGLTVSPERAARRVISGRNSFTRFDVRSAEDYADGQLGRLFLTVGFLIQALAYVRSAHGATPLSHSPEAILGLFGCIAAALLLVWTVAKVAHPWLRDRWLIKFARIDNMGWVHALPAGQELFLFGQVLGKRPYQREFADNEAYALRVFKTRVRNSANDYYDRPEDFQPFAALDDTHGYYSELPKAHWRLRGYRLVRERPDPPDLPPSPPPENDA